MSESVVGRLRAWPGTVSPPLWLGAAGLGRIGLGNALATVFLSVVAVGLVSSQLTDGGVIARSVVLLAILPLLGMRRFPALAPVAVALGALITQLTVGPMITCGVVLPVMCIMAFQLGTRLLPNRQLAIGGAGLVGTGAVELVLDPVLGTVDAAVFMFLLGTGFFVGGLMIRSRIKMVEDLRRRTTELADHRDRTAALAVAADRERVGADLEHAIRLRVAAIGEAAVLGRAMVTTSPEVARSALAEIEVQGRETLAGMRAVVGTLRDAPTEPPPGLADLQALARRATSADTRLRTEGEPRRVGSNIELSAYRILEQVLGTLTDSPRARVEVIVRFAPDALELSVTGPSPAPGRRDAEADASARTSAALTAARTRAEVVGGQLQALTSPGRRRVQVWLPTPATEQ